MPPLEPTNVVEPEERMVTGENGRTMPRWYAEAWHLSPHDRSKLRSKTFHGIAKAMATQWVKDYVPEQAQFEDVGLCDDDENDRPSNDCGRSDALPLLWE